MKSQASVPVGMIAQPWLGAPSSQACTVSETSTKNGWALTAGANMKSSAVRDSASSVETPADSVFHVELSAHGASMRCTLTGVTVLPVAVVQRVSLAER